MYIEQAPDAIKTSDIIETENVKDDDAAKSTFYVLMMCSFLRQYYMKGPFQNRDVIVSPSMAKDLEPKVETKIKEEDEVRAEENAAREARLSNPEEETSGSEESH